MKRVLISTTILLVSIMAMATQTAKVRITLAGATGGSNYVDLKEDDARTSAYESGYDVVSMMALANSRSVLIYGLVGTDSCETVATNDLNGLKIGFTSNKVDDHYTLTFSNFDGAELYLYDDVAYEIITINGSTPAYNFTIPSVGRAVYANRFRFGDAPATGNLETCFTGTELNITNNPYFGTIVVKKTSDGSTIKSYAYGTSSIDFNEKDGSGNNIYANNTEYTVYFGSGSHAFIVKVKR